MSRKTCNEPVTRSIPLRGHDQIVAALQLTALIGSDDKAVVMVKGYNDDWDEFTAIYLSDYGSDELADRTWFSDYGSPQIWVTSREGGAQ